MKKFIILAAVIMLAACKQTETIIEKPVYIHDTTQTVREVHDSTFIDRWHTITVNGDTIYIRDSIYLAKWLTKTDTAYKYIEKPVTVTLTKTEVERVKYIPWWAKILAWVGALAVVLRFAVWAWDKWGKK